MLKKVVLRFKPMSLTVAGERESIYLALKGQFEGLVAMANDAGLPQKVRLQAMGLAVQVAKAMGGILKDADLDGMNAKIEELKGMIQDAQRKKAQERLQQERDG